MKAKLTGQPDSQIRYLRFVSNTLQIKVLRDEICDEFTRKIFDYLEDEPLFDAQVFCAFLYRFIFKCRLIIPLVSKAEESAIERLKIKRRIEALFFFLEGHQIRFALPNFDLNTFSVPLEEKLKHLIETDAPEWKAARVEIILPKATGSIDIFTTADVEFILPRLTAAQKLDVLHFAICALNYLSLQDARLTIISRNLADVRRSIIDNAVRDKETDDEEQNKVEFDIDEPTTARILQAQNQDPQIEKQWLDENSPVFVKSETETKKENQTRQDNLLQNRKQKMSQIIKTTIQLLELDDNVSATDIYQKLGISKDTFYNRLSWFGYKKESLLEKARAIMREREKVGKSRNSDLLGRK